LKIAYDGSQYHGWQVQENAHSVQAEINGALQKLLSDKEIYAVGCGRTDAGVHASEFFLHFDTDKDCNRRENLIYRLNQILPKDIVVFDWINVNEEAHSRFDALSRTYQYHIIHSKNPFNQNYAAFFPKGLDLGKMNEAADVLKDYTDFTSFSKLHTDTHTNDCDLHDAKWFIQGDELVFEIKANRFLRNMVRAIVGTCIEVGKGKMEIDSFKKVIEAKDRNQAGSSVPAKGLFLTKVEYDYVGF